MVKSLRIWLANAARAERYSRDALDIARRQKAKLFEFRTTGSLARLLAGQGKRGEARAMLADIYGWFTESFDNADLKEAKALLDELNTFTEREHPLTKNLPASFEVMDELYLIELQEPTACHVLLTTQRDRIGYRRELWDVADGPYSARLRRRESGAGVPWPRATLFSGGDRSRW